MADVGVESGSAGRHGGASAGCFANVVTSFSIPEALLVESNIGSVGGEKGRGDAREGGAEGARDSACERQTSERAAMRHTVEDWARHIELAWSEQNAFEALSIDARVVTMGAVAL